MGRCLRVYVAGKLSDGTIEYLQSCHQMIRLAEEVRRAGFSVYIPCLDLLTGLVFGDLNYLDYFDNSQPWLAAADAVIVQPVGWGDSEGTGKEVKRAERLGIPVFWRKEDLIEWRDKQDETADV